jgi:hypothetical protein
LGINQNIFQVKTCDPGQANQKLLCGLHSRKSSKIRSSALIQFIQFSSIQGFPATLQFLKKMALKSTHRALAQNPPPHWQPEEEKKTDQRSSTKFNPREFIHLLSSR